MFRKRTFVCTTGLAIAPVRLKFLMAFFVITSLLQTGCQDSGSLTKGMAVVGSSLHDFGEHRQGKRLSHSFQIKNNDDHKKEIVDLRSSCTCLIAGKPGDYVGAVVEPGETITIPVFFETRGIAPKSRGTIAVLYREPTGKESRKNPTSHVELRVSANIAPDFKVSPTRVDFGEVDGLTNDVMDQVIEISPHTLDNIEQLEIVSSSEIVTFKEVIEESVQAVRRFRVGLNVNGLLGTRTMSETISIRANQKNSSVVLIPVSARYVSPMDVTPEFVVVPANQSEDVMIRITTSRPSQISEVGVSGTGDHGVRAMVRESGDSRKEHVICVSVSASRTELKHGTITATIEIEKENGKRIKHRIEVPFHLFS